MTKSYSEQLYEEYIVLCKKYKRKPIDKKESWLEDFYELEFADELMKGENK